LLFFAVTVWTSPSLFLILTFDPALTGPDTL
jgi:hypothetical protein